MPHYIGIELNNKVIRIVDVDCTGKENIKVCGAYEKVLTDEESASEESCAKIIDEIFRKNKIPRKNCALSIDSRSSFIRELQLPFTEDDAIAKIIKFEFETKVHTVSAEDMIVDYYKTSEKGKTSNVITAGVLKTNLNKINVITRKSKIEPLIFNLDLFALQNFASLLIQETNKKNCVLVYLDYEDVKIVSIQNGNLVNMRCVFNPLPKDENESQMYFEKIVMELKNTFLYYTPDVKVDAIYFLGIVRKEDARLNNIEKALGISVEVISPKKIEWNVQDENLRFERFAVPIGLSLQCANIISSRINYRKEEFRYGSVFKFARSQITLLLFLLFISEILVFFRFYSRLNERKNSYNELYNQSISEFSDVFPNEKVSGDILEQWKNKKSELEAQVGAGTENPLPVSASRYLASVYSALDKITKSLSDPTDFFYYTKINVDLSNYNITVEGLTKNPATVDEGYKFLCEEPVIKENYDPDESKRPSSSKVTMENLKIEALKFTYIIAFKKR